MCKLQGGSPGPSGNVFDWWGGRRDLCRGRVGVGAQIPSALDPSALCTSEHGERARLEDENNAATYIFQRPPPFILILLKVYQCPASQHLRNTSSAPGFWVDSMWMPTACSFFSHALPNRAPQRSSHPALACVDSPTWHALLRSLSSQVSSIHTHNVHCSAFSRLWAPSTLGSNGGLTGRSGSLGWNP